jgi:serine/threonine protein kinase/protein involved in polysaccharide export with SLBB domain/multidrug efflux pump subunit AcrA (membrane-fusion protein)
MFQSYQCPQCGSEVPGDAPQGLCPNCVLKAGFGTQQTDSLWQAGSGSASAGVYDERFVPPTPAELAPCFPDLEILELVGQGGMGVVYKARQKRLDRLVALKILSPRTGQDPAFAERFAREARAMARLNHPHVVAVYDFGQTDPPLAPSDATARERGGQVEGSPSLPLSELGRGTGGKRALGNLYFFVMEFVDGLTLRQLLEAGKLAPREALAIVPQICEALQYAHDKGVVHRDIKPENLLMDRSGQVKIADFGLAKLVGQGAKDFSLTGAGQVMGTPQYMAPEQIEHPLHVDHRADIYSLGVVFYQMLTGELPIGRFAPPSKKVQIDVRLDEVVLRALEKEPEQRYQQASEIKSHVETITTSPLQVIHRADKATAAQPGSHPAPRMSQRAKWGVAWTAFAVGCVPAAILGGSPSRLGNIEQLLLVLSLIAPVIVPILGATALIEIRRSEGRISGLGWALFDLLFFPLLGLNALIGWNLYWSWGSVGGKVFGGSTPSLVSIVFLTLIISLMIDLPIVRWAWQAANRPAKPKDVQHADMSPPSTGAPSWTLWSPFQSPKVKEICAHLTPVEQVAAAWRAAMYGVWTCATFAGPIGFGVFYRAYIAEVLVLIVPLILLHFACIPIWQRKQREFLCSTAWAKQQGIAPDQLTRPMTLLVFKLLLIGAPAFALCLLAADLLSRQTPSLPQQARLAKAPIGAKEDDVPIAQHDRDLASIGRQANIQPLDVLQIRAINIPPDQPIDGYYLVEPDGNVALGPLYGRAKVDGLTMEQAEAKITHHLKRLSRDPAVQVTLAIRPSKWRRAAFPKLPFTISPYDVLQVRVIEALPDQPIDNYYMVEPAGTIPLGPTYGRVHVSGLSLEAAEKAIEKKLGPILSKPLVQVMLAINSADLPGVHWQEVAMPKAPYTIQPGDLLFIDAIGTEPDQPIQGVQMVEPTGTVPLGSRYGRAKVEGLSLEAAEQAITKKLSEYLRQPEVSVTLAGWTSQGIALAPGPQVPPSIPSNWRGSPRARAGGANPVATPGNKVTTISASGTIEPTEVVTVSAPLAGTIVSFGADPRADSDTSYQGKVIDYGSPVEKGTVMAKIDDTLYKARLDQQKTAVQRAEAELAAARAKAKGKPSEEEKAAVAVAEAAVTQAKSVLREAENNLDRTTIRSPVKGVVVDRRVNIGQAVTSANSDSPFMIAKDCGKMQVWASVHEANIGLIHKGTEATFSVDGVANAKFKGTVTQIRRNATMTQDMVTYTVVVEGENPNHKLVPYQRTNIEFRVGP